MAYDEESPVRIHHGSGRDFRHYRILLIFFYLFWVVIPLFASPKVENAANFSLNDRHAGDPIIHASLEEYAEIALTIAASGRFNFFSTADGAPVLDGVLRGADNGQIIAASDGDPATRTFSSR